MTRQLTSKSLSRAPRAKDTPPKRGLKLTTHRNTPADHPNPKTNSSDFDASSAADLSVQELELTVGDQFTVGECTVRVIASENGEATLELVNLRDGSIDDRVMLGEDVRPRQPR